MPQVRIQYTALERSSYAALGDIFVHGSTADMPWNCALLHDPGPHVFSHLAHSHI